MKNATQLKLRFLVGIANLALALTASLTFSSCCDIHVYNRNAWYDDYYIKPIAGKWGDQHHFYLLKADELNAFDLYAAQHKPSEAGFKYKDREVFGTSNCDIPCRAIKMVDGRVWLFEELPGTWEDESAPPSLQNHRLDRKASCQV